jgi:hypothetical protein
VFDEFLVVLKPGLKGEFEQVTPELVQGEGLRGVSLGEQVVFFGRKDRIDKGRYSFASSQATRHIIVDLQKDRQVQLS